MEVLIPSVAARERKVAASVEAAAATGVAVLLERVCCTNSPETAKSFSQGCKTRHSKSHCKT